MAEIVVATKLVDDVDKRDGAERLYVERGGQIFEIDLLPEKVEELWQTCVQFGRRVRRSGGKPRYVADAPAQSAAPKFRPATQASVVRDWAWKHGLDLVKKEGRVSGEVVQAYERYQEGNDYYLRNLQANPAFTSTPTHTPDRAGQRELTDPATS